MCGSRSLRFSGSLRSTALFARLASALRIQQQRLLALHQARQRRGDLDGGHVVLAFELFDQCAERVAFARCQRLADAFLEACDALLVHVLDARQLHRLDAAGAWRARSTRSMLRSRGAMNRIASPLRPARPVRPMRCT